MSIFNYSLSSSDLVICPQHSLFFRMSSVTRALIHLILVHPLKTQQPSFNHQTRPEYCFLSGWKSWLYWWGRVLPECLVLGGYVEHLSPVYPLIARRGIAAVVKLVNCGGEQTFPRLALRVCALHTSKFQGQVHAEGEWARRWPLATPFCLCGLCRAQCQIR